MTSIKSSATSSSQSADESLWLKLLRESSTRGVTPDASCIVVGDADGAKGIMDSVGQSLASNHESSSQDGPLEMLCYDYMDIEDSALETNTKIHFWNFDERLISLNNELLPPPITASTLHKLMYIVAIDLTKREAEMVQTVKHWLKLIADQISSYYGDLPFEDNDSLKRSYLQYMATVRLHKGNASHDVETSEHQQLLSAFSSKSFTAMERFYVPIIVVGCKSDKLNFNDVAVLRQMKEIQGKLRLMCLEVGAALICPSKEQELQKHQLLKSYITHRLFSEYVRMDLALEEKIEQTFIPSGFDTLDLINISTGQKHWSSEEFLSFISSQTQLENAIVDQTMNQITNFATMESEQEWLNGLQSFISTISASGEAPKIVSNLSDLLNEAESEPKSKQSMGSNSSTASAAGAAIPVPTTSRRASVRTAAPLAGGEKKDVKDFFQNLLANPNPKK